MFNGKKNKLKKKRKSKHKKYKMLKPPTLKTNKMRETEVVVIYFAGFTILKCLITLTQQCTHKQTRVVFDVQHVVSRIGNVTLSSLAMMSLLLLVSEHTIRTHPYGFRSPYHRHVRTTT